MKHSVLSILIMTVFMVSGCEAPPDDAMASQAKAAVKKPLVEVIPAQKQRLTKSTETTGELVSANTVTIRSSVEGPISFCPWREGDRIKKGERLVEIKRPLYRQEVRSAQAALAVARARLADMIAGPRKEEIAQAAQSVRELEACAAFTATDLKRVNSLVQSKGLPEEELDKARLAAIKCDTSLAVAREKHNMLKSGPTATDIAVQKALVQESSAKLDIARAKLDECVITAPFNGVVTQVEVHAGDLAQARSPLLSVMEESSVVLKFGVPESDIHSLTDNTELSVMFDALPNRTYTAHIERMYPEIDTRTRTRTVEARVDSSESLVPGMFARIRVDVQSSDTGVVVPDRALLTRGGGQSVVFVVSDENAEQRKVTTGIENGSCIQIIDGVKPGENVVVAGHEKLKSGAAVKMKIVSDNSVCVKNKSGHTRS